MISDSVGKWSSLGQLAMILFVALLDTAAEFFMRLGALHTNEMKNPVEIFGTTALLSPWTWLGIVMLIAGFISWTQVLRFVPLGIACTLSNIVQVTVPIGAFFLLHEHISPTRWAGIILVVIGLAVVAQPFIKIEEKL